MESHSAPQGTPAFAAGWYPDPWGQGHRYWDGYAWTSYAATPAPAPGTPWQPEPQIRAGDWIGAFLLPVIMPLIGLIAGVVYIARGDHRARVGWICAGLSAAMILLYAALIAAG